MTSLIIFNIEGLKQFLSQIEKSMCQSFISNFSQEPANSKISLLLEIFMEKEKKMAVKKSLSKLGNKKEACVTFQC